MKKTHLLKVMLMAMVVSLGFASCEKEDGSEGIMVRMSNADNGRTEIHTVGGRVFINSANNFYVKDGAIGAIASVGKVSGFSKIKKVPPLNISGGWAQEVAVEPGMGYVVISYDSNGTIVDENGDTYVAARIWVEDWIEGTSGGIIGAVVYYEYVWSSTIKEE